MSAIAPTITQKEQKTFRSPLCTVCVLQALWAEPCRPCHGGFLCCVVTSSRLFDGRLCCPSMMIRAPPPPHSCPVFYALCPETALSSPKNMAAIPENRRKGDPSRLDEGIPVPQTGTSASNWDVQGGSWTPSERSFITGRPCPPPGGRVDDKRHLYGSSAKPSHQIRLYLFPPNIGQPPRGTLPEQFT